MATITLGGTVNSVYTPGSQFDYTPSITGGTAPYTFSSTNLPSYLTLNTSTGEIVGTLPSTEENVSFTLNVTDGTDTGSETISFAVTAPIAFTYNTSTVYVDEPSTLTPTTTGGTLSTITWAVTSGTLPAGMSISSSTGIISGTPTAVGNFPITITASNAQESTPETLYLVVHDQITLSYNTSQYSEVGVSSSYAPTVSGGNGTFTYTLASGTLPQGLVVSPTTGDISGTPTENGTFTGSVSVTDGTVTSTASFDIFVYPSTFSTTVSYPSIPAENGFHYSNTPVITGPLHDPVWTLTTGTLTTGLALDSATGVISGTPTVVGTDSVTITLTDGPFTTTASVNITTDAVLSMNVVFSSSYLLSTNLSVTPTVTGGAGTILFSSPNIPPYLTLDPSTGTVAGILPSNPSDVSFTLVASDNYTTSSKTVSFVVADTLAISYTVSPLNINKAVTLTPVVDGGYGNQTWSIQPSLPTGLVINATTGVISGTPTVASSATVYTVTVNDASGSTTTSFTTEVVSPLSLTLSAVNTTYKNGSSIDITSTASGGSGTYTYTSQFLPSFLSLDSSTGAVTGTVPATNTNVAFNIILSDGFTSVSQPVAFTVYTAISFTYADVIITEGQTGAGAPLVTGGYGTQTWTITSGTIPTGLSLNTNNGTIGGIPTVAGTVTLDLSVTDSSGTATGSVVVDVVTIIDITTSTSPVLVAGTYGEFVPAATGGYGLQVWTINTGSLPPGMVHDASTGIISGIPTTVGTYTFSLNVQDNSGTSGVGLSFKVQPPLTLLTYPKFATVNVPYSFVPVVQGRPGPFTYSLTGTLPTGISFSSQDGSISGTASAVVISPMVLTITDSIGSNSFPFNMTVNPAPMVFSPPAVDIYLYMGKQFSYNPPLTGGNANKLWSVKYNKGTPWSNSSSKALPPGLTLNTSTGQITGAVNLYGSYTTTLQVYDGTTTEDFVINFSVVQEMVLSGSIENAIVNSPYYFLPTLRGNSPPYRFSLSGKLPTGLTFDTATGTISGTPTVVNQSEIITITVQDVTESTVSLSGVISVFSEITQINDSLIFGDFASVSEAIGTSNFTLAASNFVSAILDLIHAPTDSVIQYYVNFYNSNATFLASTSFQTALNAYADKFFLNKAQAILNFTQVAAATSHSFINIRQYMTAVPSPMIYRNIAALYNNTVG